MRRLARLLLLCLISLALPFQAAYAVATPSCGFATHGHGPEALQDQADGHHDHHAGSGIDEAATAHAVDAAVGDHPAVDGAHPHAHASPAKGSCSVCTPCCSSAAPPPGVATVAEPRIEMDAVRPLLHAASVSFLTDGPERPPRATLD
jgi:hypothetical protein